MATSKTLIPNPEATVALISDIKAGNLALELEVKTKIEKLLKAKGYNIGRVQDSDYYLFFWYGVGKDVPDLSGLPLPKPDGTSATQLLEPDSNKPGAETDYSRWLRLKLIDGKRFSETKGSSYIWVGEATSSGPNSDIKEVIDYLLIPAFDHFGENTGKKLTVTMRDGDERIKYLMK